MLGLLDLKGQGEHKRPHFAALTDPNERLGSRCDTLRRETQNQSYVGNGFFDTDRQYCDYYLDIKHLCPTKSEVSYY